MIVPENADQAFGLNRSAAHNQPDTPAEAAGENPYLALRAKDPVSPLPPEEQIDGQAADGETPTERYIRLAAESTNTTAE